MLRTIRASLLAAIAAVLFVAPVRAATFIVPPDEKLVDDSSAIVFGTVIRAEPRFTEIGEIETVYTIAIDEVLKGKLDSMQTSVVEWGGVINGKGMVMSGAPRYEVGKQYLVFMTENRNGEWTTQHLTLGRFESVRTEKGELLVRDTSEVHGWDIHGNPPVEIERKADTFRAFVRERARGRDIRTNAQEGSSPASSGVVTPNFAGYDLEDASAVGAAAWVDDSGSDVSYSISGAPASGNVKDVFDSEERIIEEDPNNVIAGAFSGSGVVATAFWGFNAPDHSFDSHTFSTITGSDVVTQNGFKDSGLSQSTFRSVMAHELGHTLGFRHSNEECPTGAPCVNQAIMNSSVGASNGVLQQYDIDAVRAVYGSGGDATHYVKNNGRRTNTSVSFKIAELGCIAPAITTQPQNKSVSVGSTTSLSVVAGGTTPFTFQWFFGNSPDTTNPVNGATSSSINITPTSPGVGSYWVRVSNSCGSPANSNTATVTATCTNPAITGQSPNPTISEGSSTQLSVTATGSGLVFQWFEGAVGDTSQPRGTNSSTLTVTPSTTRSYWVNVTGLCGSPVRSSAFVVTVVPCATITVDPPTATAGTGAGNYNLNVIASSTSLPLTYTWFRGNTPGFGGTSLGTGQTKNVTVTAATGFWARVQNGCGRVEFSSLITLAPCTLPTITSQPTDKSVNFNQTAQLSIGVSAGATVTWYRGVVGDITNQIGTGTAINTPALTATTLFWARVSNTCGPISSRQVTVTVNQLTELVPMLNGRFFVQVRYINQFDNNKEGKLLGRSLFNSPISDTAIFTFGDPLVVELMVRLSDARPFEDKIHLFLGGLSDVEFSIVVTDSQTGIIREYRKPANQLVGAIDRTSFPGGISLQSGLDSLMAQTVAPNTNVELTVKVLNNRFEVRMRYRNQFTNPAGEGYMNGRSIASSPTTETAVFFFDQNVGSVEWMVRFSDARPFANRIDMFHGGLSDVEFTIEVLDTKTGVRKEYHKGPFSLLGQVDRDSYVP